MSQTNLQNIYNATHENEQNFQINACIEKPVITEQPIEQPKPSDWRSKLKNKLHDPLISFQTKLIGSGEIVNYNSMTTREMKKILLYGNIEDPRLIDEVLDMLICEVVITPNFNIDPVYTYDRIQLLVAIRINSKGGQLESSYTCSNCEGQVYFSHNLNEFETVEKPTDIDHEIKVNETFSLYLDYNTRKDQKELLKFANTQNDSEKLNTELQLLNLAALIKGIKIDSETVMFPEFSYKDRYETFMDLPESVLDKIIEWDKKNAFGLKMRYRRKCFHCGNEEEIEIPINALF